MIKNKTVPKKTVSLPSKKVLKEKISKSDAFFHRVAMSTQGDVEKEDLAVLETLGPKLAEQQIIGMLDAQHRLQALAGFQQLIKLYADHSQRLVWEGLVRMLEKE